MQKFTIFTIIFSAVIIVTVSELVVSDYMERHAEDQEDATVADNFDPSNLETSIIGADPNQIEPETVETVQSVLSTLDFTLFGFASGTELDEKNFPDKVFQFLEFDNDTSTDLYYELFANGSYEGSIYEIIAETPTDAFTIYTDLKSSALDNSSSGSINEVNNYGLASFYFNDNIQTNTVFLVILGEDRVFAFNYPKEFHDMFKGVADSL